MYWRRNTEAAERTAVASKRKSALARSRAMQRRGINKRLSFAEAENGQKDRNKEEVAEEREAVTERGINKPGRRRARGQAKVGAGAVATVPPLTPSCRFNDQRPDLLLLRCTTVLALKTFQPVSCLLYERGRCTSVSLSGRPLPPRQRRVRVEVVDHLEDVSNGF